MTGAAGFIGSALCEALLARGDRVIGIDNFSPQYDPSVKRANLASSARSGSFSFVELDVTDPEPVRRACLESKPDCVVHIAGRTGLRASLENPEPYYHANVWGTLSMLEACRSSGTGHVLYASSGSVYGDSGSTPANEERPLPPPASPYVATKILGEALCERYSSLVGINATVLRIFTVYGPRQREELGVSRFIEAIDRGEPVRLYGKGGDRRDWIFSGNCVDAILCAIDRPFRFEIVNVGEESPTTLAEVVGLLAELMGREAVVEHAETPRGVPVSTFASIEKAKRLLGWIPRVGKRDGLARCIAWHRASRRNGC